MGAEPNEDLPVFSERERRDPLRAAKRLLLAAQDMQDTVDSARGLEDRHGYRPYETALAISYARPWTLSNTIKPLEKRWLPDAPQELELHASLMRLRDRLYAHTDDEFGARGIRDVSGITGEPGPRFAVEWRPMSESLLPSVVVLAERQQAKFRAAAAALSALVVRFVVEVRWSQTIQRPERTVLLDELESEVFALRPARADAPADERLVQIELVEPARDDGEEFEYAVRRLCRSVSRCRRQLKFPPSVELVLEGQLQALPHDALNAEVIVAEHRRRRADRAG